MTPKQIIFQNSKIGNSTGQITVKIEKQFINDIIPIPKNAGIGKF